MSDIQNFSYFCTESNPTYIMADIKRITKTSNIILLAVMLCCIGGCFSLVSQESKQRKETEKAINELPHLTLVEDIAEAINAPTSRIYLIVNYVFPKLEYVYVEDPANNFDCKFIYLQYTKSKHHDKVVKNGEVKKAARWSTEQFDTYYSPLYIYKDIELEGFDGARTGGCTTDTIRSGKYRHEYEYIRSDAPCTFVATLGQHRAILGYNDSRVLVKGGVYELCKATSTDMNHAFLGFFLILAVNGILFYVIRDIIKH